MLLSLRQSLIVSKVSLPRGVTAGVADRALFAFAGMCPSVCLLFCPYPPCFSGVCEEPYTHAYPTHARSILSSFSSSSSWLLQCTCCGMAVAMVIIHFAVIEPSCLPSSYFRFLDRITSGIPSLTHSRTYTHMYTHSLTHTLTHTHTHIHAHVHTHSHTHTLAHSHTRTCTHSLTHTHPSSSPPSTLKGLFSSLDRPPLAPLGFNTALPPSYLSQPK